MFHNPRNNLAWLDVRQMNSQGRIAVKPLKSLIAVTNGRSERAFDQVFDAIGRPVFAAKDRGGVGRTPGSRRTPVYRAIPFISRAFLELSGSVFLFRVWSENWPGALFVADNLITKRAMSEIIPYMPPVDELPEEVRALRHDRDRAFVWTYMFNGANGAAACRSIGVSDVKDHCKVQAHRLLQRADIQDALRALGQRYLFSLQPKALVRLGELVGSKNERVALKAVDMTLSRTGMSERTALDVNVSGEVRHVDHTSAAVADLRRMKGLGVPREALEQVFGFSGLSRYEKLLAAEDAKMIEATATEVRE